MMHIAYKLHSSPTHGIGIFADQYIAKGELLFSASPQLDVDITQEQFDALHPNEQKEIRYWGFFDTHSQKWHVDFDHIHFINHSYDANTTQDFSHPEAHIIAMRDIQKGEELTQNYLEFETQDDLDRRGIPRQ